MVAYQPTDINAIKACIIEKVMNMDNPKIVQIVEDVILELTLPKGKRPVQYTIEELNEEIRKSEEDITAERVIDWEDLKKEWDKFLKHTKI